MKVFKPHYSAISPFKERSSYYDTKEVRITESCPHPLWSGCVILLQSELWLRVSFDAELSVETFQNQTSASDAEVVVLAFPRSTEVRTGSVVASLLAVLTRTTETLKLNHARLPPPRSSLVISQIVHCLPFFSKKRVRQVLCTVKVFITVDFSVSQSFTRLTQIGQTCTDIKNSFLL